MEELIFPPELAKSLGLTEGHLAQLRYTGKGPKFVKLTGRQVRYRPTDVAEWLEAQTRTRTDGSEAGRPKGKASTGSGAAP
jgi:predicted DNA-binding transcriptional regulator AlpA